MATVYAPATRANPFAPAPSVLDEEERALIAARDKEQAALEEAKRAERRRIEMAAEEEAQRARIAGLRGQPPTPTAPVAAGEAPGPLSGPEWDVRGQLSRAVPALEDRRAQFEPGAPMRAPGSPDPVIPGRARAIRLPNGKILLTNRPENTGGEEVTGAQLFQAVRGGDRAASAAPSREGDWRTGTNMEGPAALSYGRREFLPEGGFTARDIRGQAGGGTLSMGDAEGRGSIADNPDTAARLSLEDADRAAAVYRSQADVETARQAAEFAQLSPQERAQIQAASKAPELIGFQAIQEEYAKLQKAQAAFNEWQQRAEDPNDPAFVEPNKRQLAARMMQDRLGLTGAEDRIKTLASIVGQQRVPQGLLGSLGG